MTITRAEAALYLDTQFGNLAREVMQVTNDDSAVGYGADIDQALRKLSYVESDIATAIVAADYRDVYFALADYYALRRFARLLATKVDIGQAHVREGDRNRVFDNVLKLLEMAETTIEEYGYSVGSGSGWELARLTLDFLEPDVSG